MTFVGSTPVPTSQIAQVLKYSLGTLVPGAKKDVSIVATINLGAGGTLAASDLVNSASVSMDSPDGNPTNDSKSVTVSIAIK
jgi:hypothetical protein